MRLKALIPNHPQLDIAIIHQESPTSFMLYKFSRNHDHGFDSWYPNLHSAKYQCEQDYGIGEDEWEQISDVLPGALPQFENPMVAVTNELGIAIDFISYDEALSRGIVPPKPIKINIVDDPELIAEVRKFLDQNDSLRAIRVYVTRTGCNILTAQRAIKYLRENNS